MQHLLFYKRNRARERERERTAGPHAMYSSVKKLLQVSWSRVWRPGLLNKCCQKDREGRGESQVGPWQSCDLQVSFMITTMCWTVVLKLGFPLLGGSVEITCIQLCCTILKSDDQCVGTGEPIKTNKMNGITITNSFVMYRHINLTALRK